MPDIYFGKLDFNHGDWARIRPSHGATSEGWQPLVDAGLDFPTQGLAFIPASLNLSRAAEGTSWVFRRTANTRGGDAPDRFVVQEIAPPIPLYDYRQLTLEQARSRLRDTGVKIPGATVRNIAVALTDDLIAIFDVDSRAGARWNLPSNAGEIPLMSAPNGWLTSGGIGGQQYLPVIGMPHLPVVRRVNWMGDSELVERVLLRLRRQSAQAGDQASGLPGRDAIQRIARSLETTGVFSQAGDDFDGELARLSDLWPRIQQQFAFSDHVRQLILESDSVKDRIEAEVKTSHDSMIESLRPDIEARIRAEVDASLNAARLEFEEIRLKIATLQEQVAQDTNLAAIASEESRDEARRLAEIKQSVHDLTEDVRRELESLSPSEFAQVSRLPDRLTALLAETGIALPRGVPPWSSRAPNNGATWIDGEHLDDVLVQQARANGIESLQELDALLRAGELVLLSGPASIRAVTAYCDAVAGGALRTMSLDPSFIGLDDLWSSHVNRMPTALAQAWCEAETSPDRPVLIQIACLDSAPFHLWLAGLVATLRSSIRPRNLLVIATSIGLGTNDSRAPNPHADAFLRWMAPSLANDSRNALLAIQSVGVKRQPPTLLRWQTPKVEDALKDPDVLQHLTGMPGDASIRVARLAAALGARAPSRESMLATWAGLLSGRTTSPVNENSTAGTEIFASLHFQA